VAVAVAVTAVVGTVGMVAMTAVVGTVGTVGTVTVTVTVTVGAGVVTLSTLMSKQRVHVIVVEMLNAAKNVSKDAGDAVLQAS